ncbi:MAG: 4Fe-4S binding protein [Anaerolineales bacterium]
MRLYPVVYKKLYPHWLHRFAFFLLGVILLYAPFALLTRLVLYLTNAPYTADVHRICLRMPIQWLAQPWMYGTIVEQLVYLFAVLILPLIALFVGPLFCGWMCPAGLFTEFLSRFVPPRFQMDLSNKVSAVPVRYGFMVGMMGVAFVGGNVCCSFCNFTHTQNIISGVFGNFSGLAYWASFSIISFALWFAVLGIFTKGGRGWCNFLCPAGALMGLAHSIGAKLKIGRGMRVDRNICQTCKSCAASCPAWAISNQSGETKINTHACNICMDCSHICPRSAISYGPILPERVS